MRNTPPPTRRVRAAHESKSAAVRAAAAAPSRRQQSRWQREQHQQHTLYIAIGVLVGLVVLIFGGGIFYDNVVRANEVVAQIGPDSITATQLLDEIRPAVRALDAQAKTLGTGANIASYVDSQKRSLPDQTINDLIDQHVIAQEAARRGISVTAAELDDKERQTVADFQAATNPTPTAEPVSTPDPAVAPQETAVPTPTAVPSPSPSPQGSPTPVPTLETAAYGTGLQSLLDRNNLTESEFRAKLEQSMLREKVTTAIGEEQVAATQEQVHARHILVATQQQATDVLTQLQGGADFATLAQQVSIDPGSKDKGGDLGWFGRGVMDKPFEDAAFALQPGQTSDVVQGANGFHVIQVLERDPARAIADTQLTTQRQKAFSDWLSSRRTSQDVKLQLSQPARDWVLARLGVRP
ncbi:MAG TPA: peptidylprolyl isomerase [Chloroflexota bacterium]|jgi:parvulin-like peptidyl-prolyl isomerase|nr:peptidylprolyl isomerase [Chloroflexota bacterium]